MMCFSRREWRKQKLRAGYDGRREGDVFPFRATSTPGRPIPKCTRQTAGPFRIGGDASVRLVSSSTRTLGKLFKVTGGTGLGAAFVTQELVFAGVFRNT